MKDEEAQTTAAAAAASTTTTTTTTAKKEGSYGGLFAGRGKYKFWALTAIVCLAYWSVFTGSVTLKRIAVHLNHGSDDLDIQSDLDILEVEEREKLVRHIWDVYTLSKTVKLPLFWQEAFEAAYEDLTSGGSDVRDTAISEIAKMSLVRSNLQYELEPTIAESRASEREEKLRRQSAKT